MTASCSRSCDLTPRRPGVDGTGQNPGRNEPGEAQPDHHYRPLSLIGTDPSPDGRLPCDTKSRGWAQGTNVRRRPGARAIRVGDDRPAGRRRPRGQQRRRLHSPQSARDDPTGFAEETAGQHGADRPAARLRRDLARGRRRGRPDRRECPGPLLGGQRRPAHPRPAVHHPQGPQAAETRHATGQVGAAALVGRAAARAEGRWAPRTGRPPRRPG